MFRLSSLSLLALSITPALAEQEPFWITARSNFIAGYQEEGNLPRHAHDPQQDIYVQGVELGLNVQPTEWFSGFFNVNTFQDQDGLNAEWEEGFLKFSVPDYGVELRAGRYLNRIGTQNTTHLHGWDFVDANLSTVYFLGDEGLVTEGAELSWGMEFEKGLVYVSTSYGQVVAHNHGHDEDGHDDHDEDEHDDHDEDEHDDHDEDGHDDHDEDGHDDHDEDGHDDHDEDEHDDHDEHEHDDHGHEEHGELGFQDEVFTTRALIKYNFTDFHQNTLGVNYVKSVGGDDTSLWGVDYTYQWRQNGLEAGGRALTVTGEYFAFDNGEDTQNSALLSSVYDFGNGWSLGARYEWIEFASELDNELLGTEERQRLSSAVTYTQQINEDWTGMARLQYNQDWSESDSSGAWLQLGFSYGGGEVR